MKKVQKTNLYLYYLFLNLIHGDSHTKMHKKSLRQTELAKVKRVKMYSKTSVTVMLFGETRLNYQIDRIKKNSCYSPCPLASLSPPCDLTHKSSCFPCVSAVRSSGWQQGVGVCLRTADSSSHGGGGHYGASLRGCGPGLDSCLRRLPLPAAGSHDHPLCEGHHGPLQRNPNLHMGGTAPG